LVNENGLKMVSGMVQWLGRWSLAAGVFLTYA